MDRHSRCIAGFGKDELDQGLGSLWTSSLTIVDPELALFVKERIFRSL